MSEASTDRETLRAIPFFAGLADEDLDGILRVGRPVAFDQAEAIVHQGDAGNGMYILVEGTAEVDVGGRFHRLGPGQFFGEMALISAGKRMATVTATSPVQALEIPAEEFQAFVLDHPKVALSMMRALVSRLREVEERIDAWMAN
jgi:CPA2 family monovalent cation:H+ antiporter-2